MGNAFDKLRPFLAKERRLNHIISLLNYDVQCLSPSKAIASEADIINSFAADSAAIKKDPTFISAVKEAMADPSLNERQRVVVEGLYKDVIFFEKVSLEEYSYWSEALSSSNEAWRKAKEHDDFASYLPYWKKAIEAARKMAELRKTNKAMTLYDSCLNHFEEGLSAEMIEKTFAPLKEFLISHLPAVMEEQSRRSHPKIPFIPAWKQRAFNYDLLNLIGFDFSRGAISESMHPFTDFFAPNDVRVTTEIEEADYRDNIFSVIHEGGHAIEFQNFDQAQFEDFSEMHCSNTICETHSRFYENIIGRSRFFAIPLRKLCQKHFGSHFYFLGLDDFTSSLNEVKPSLNRCGADEYTYCLHVIIRFEIEREILNGNLSAEEAPALWNKKYKEYLGIDVPNDREGILQDVHWSDASFGYFPSYALGNLYGAMIYERMAKELPLEELFSSGNLIPIREWFAENDFRYNYLPSTKWIQKVLGKDLDVNPFLNYLAGKYLPQN